MFPSRKFRCACESDVYNLPLSAPTQANTLRQACTSTLEQGVENNFVRGYSQIDSGVSAWTFFPLGSTFYIGNLLFHKCQLSIQRNCSSFIRYAVPYLFPCFYPGPSSAPLPSWMRCSVCLCHKNGNEETCSDSKTSANVNNNTILVPIPARLIFVQVFSFHMWTKCVHVIRHCRSPTLLHFSDKYIRQNEEHIKLFFARYFAGRKTSLLHWMK